MKFGEDFLKLTLKINNADRVLNPVSVIKKEERTAL